MSSAQAQVAEATKAAVDAGGVVLKEGELLGAICILLALSLAASITLLIRAQNRYADLVERVAGIAESSKNASALASTAMATLSATFTETTRAVQELGRETEGESRENRHAINNFSQVVQNLSTIVQRLVERGKP